MCVSTKIPGHVCRQPLHDDVVGPVHAEVCNIYGPQWPVTDELCPPWTAVGHLCNVACQHYINDNNNYHDNIYGTVIMTKVTVRDHSVHLMNVDWALGGHQPSDKTIDLGCESAENWLSCYYLHPPLPFVIITQHTSWCSFYRPM